MNILQLRIAALHKVQHEYEDCVTTLLDMLVIKRIEEIEGRVPDQEEVTKHGNKSIRPTGCVVFTWKDQPIVGYVPATFDHEGNWRHAEVSEIRPATEADADMSINFSRNGNGS